MINVHHIQQIYGTANSSLILASIICFILVLRSLWATYWDLSQMGGILVWLNTGELNSQLKHQYKTIVAGWTNPFEKIWTSKWVHLPQIEMNINKYLSCHHLENNWHHSRSPLRHLMAKRSQHLKERPVVLFEIVLFHKFVLVKAKPIGSMYGIFIYLHLP